MPGHELLDHASLPDTFEYVIKGQLSLPLAVVETHDYRFRAPQQALFRSGNSFLDLALSHRPGEALGRYVDSPGHRAQPMGDVIFIPAGQGLSTRWGPGPQSSVCCQFRPAITDDHEFGWSESELEASLDVRNVFVRDALIRLAREIEAPGFCSAILAESICTQLCIELGRYFQTKRRISQENAGQLCAAQIRAIEERLDCAGKPPTVAEIAAECGLSTRHFFRLFRATTGTTLSEFAAARRIASAKALLTRRTPSVKEIAYRCGFETSAAFSAAFRRATGSTPRQYRRDMAS